MIVVTTTSAIEGYRITAYKGSAQGLTFDELLRNAEALGANAILNTCYDDARDVETLFHGAAVVVEPLIRSKSHAGSETHEERRDRIRGPSAACTRREN